ncbi:MAG: hypothetical protein R2694_07105 [Ilumatobacteraceae bacterium]
MVEQLGLDPGRRLLPGVTDPFAAVSDQRLVLGRQGGFRFTPKDELLSLERPAFRLLWWDETHPGPDERHVVIQVADGTWWDTSSVVHDGYNSAGFLYAPARTPSRSAAEPAGVSPHCGFQLAGTHENAEVRVGDGRHEGLDDLLEQRHVTVDRDAETDLRHQTDVESSGRLTQPPPPTRRRTGRPSHRRTDRHHAYSPAAPRLT